MSQKNKQIDVLDRGFVRLVDWMGDDSAIVQAARVSYGDGTKTVRQDAKLIDYLIRNYHTSPLEQVVFKFHVKLPIFVARQIVRHRTASLNEVSARYSELPDEFYIPELSRVQGQDVKNKQASDGEELKSSKEARTLIQAASQEAYNHYLDLLSMGVSRELARAVLPVNIYSEWYWQMDLHNLMHFFRLRIDDHAQYETRKYAEAKLELIEPIVPAAIESFKKHRMGQA